jgi:hypothetical protein
LWDGCRSGEAFALVVDDQFLIGQTLLVCGGAFIV